MEEQLKTVNVRLQEEQQGREQDRSRTRTELEQLQEQLREALQVSFAFSTGHVHPHCQVNGSEDWPQSSHYSPTSTVQ